MDEKQDKKPAESAPVETKKNKISLKAGQKNQIIINPPEKPPVKNVNELFASARQKHAVVLEKKTELVLQAKARQADLPEQALVQVFIRGFKNLPINSQLTREQYAMNRVNSFIAGGAAMVEDCDLLPIQERIVHIGRKGTGGGSRPHIKREKSPYNNKVVYHVVDAKGVVKHSTGDEGEAKKHLAQKYNNYLGEAKKLKGEDPCWKGYHMVGKKNKAGREVPNCVPNNEEVEPIAELSKQTLTDYMARAKKGQLRTTRSILAGSQSKNVAREYDNRTTGIIKARARINKEEVEPVNEISKELANRYYWSAKSSGDEMDKKISSKVKKLGDKWSQRTHNNLTDLLAKSQKRTAGRLRALDRLNKHEEVQPIEEISSEKLNKYIQRSTAEHGHYNMARRNTTGDQQKEFARKETKRAKGISKAFDKLDAKQKVTEATSVAIRMQRALDKIKAERERKERLAAPFVNSVFGKKDDKPEPKKD